MGMHSEPVYCVFKTANMVGSVAQHGKPLLGMPASPTGHLGLNPPLLPI